MRAVRRLSLGFLFFSCFSLLLGQQIAIRPQNETGIYQSGQQAAWLIDIKEGTPSSLKDVRYLIKQGGLEVVREGRLDLAKGHATVQATSKSAGWLLLEVTAKGSNGEDIRALGGALFSPGEIRPSAPAPADFDAFWASKLKELSTVPTNPRLTPEDSGAEGVDSYLITMDNIRGSHIHGRLARPAKPGQFPALLIVQWAGVYPLDKAWAVDRAREGWLVLNIEAHDLPVDEPEEFYRKQSQGPLKDYPAIGNEDRETSYFLRMYLSCYRGAEYLTTRKDWDGRTLVVTGASQGGLQSILTAAIHPGVTAVLADVPAGCDQTGPEVGRSPGWPKWYFSTEGRDAAKVKQASRYYDIVNFAPKVKCPVLVGTGLIDTTCPPCGVYAACNRLQGYKEIVVFPTEGHQGEHKPYRDRWAEWLELLRNGKIPGASAKPF